MSLIVKICGLSTRETLDVALQAGADMVGFVFFPLSPRHIGLETARELADYFASIPPTPANDGDRALAEIGRAIYLEGIPEYDVASCAACHGPDAEGIGPIPRLGGLSYSYLARRLAQWGEGYHVAAAPPMPRIASRLAPDEIAALASYLSFVP